MARPPKSSIVDFLMKAEGANAIDGSSTDADGRYYRLAYNPVVDGWVLIAKKTPSSPEQTFDLVVKEQWGQCILVVIRWMSKSRFAAIGHGVLVRSQFRFKLDGGSSSFKMLVDHEQPQYARFRSTPPQVNASHDQGYELDEEDLDDGPELTEADLARLRGELPLTPTVTYKRPRFTRSY